MEEPGDKPPSSSQPLPEPPPPTSLSSPFSKVVSRKGLLRKQAARMKLGRSLSPRFLASTTSKLPSKGRKTLATIPETRAIWQQLTYGLFSDPPRPAGECGPALKRDGRKKGGNGKWKDGDNSVHQGEEVFGKKDAEEDAFEDCIEEDSTLEEDSGSENVDMLMLEGTQSKNRSEELHAGNPHSPEFVRQIPAAGHKGTNEHLTVAAMNKTTDSIYAKDVPNPAAKGFLVAEQGMQTKDFSKGQHIIFLNKESGPETPPVPSSRLGCFNTETARDLDASQPLQPPRKPPIILTDGIPTDAGARNPNFDANFPPLERGPSATIYSNLDTGSRVGAGQGRKEDTHGPHNMAMVLNPIAPPFGREWYKESNE